MSNSIFPPHLSSSEELELRSLRDVRFEMSEQTRSLIANDKQLAEKGIRAMQESAQAMSGAIQETGEEIQGALQSVSYGIDEVSGQLEEMSAAFHWGFSEMLVSIGNMQDSLTTLIEIEKSPERIWAYEQYGNAKYSFQRGLYREALTHIIRAIEGHGDRTGYELEYRFHYLLGTVRIGSRKNFDPDIVDPQKAEKAFLLAGRYAEYDYKKEAARAYVAAGWSAFVSGNVDRAIVHTKKAISLNPFFAEAYFQLGKILCYSKNKNEAFPIIKKAIELDPLYSIKVAADKDIKKYEKDLSVLLLDIKEESKKRAEDIRANIIKASSLIENIKFHDQETKKMVLRSIEFPQETIKSGDQQLHTDTFFGALKARDAYVVLGNKLRSFSEYVMKDIEQKITKNKGEADSLQTEHNNNRKNIISNTANKITSILGKLLFIFFIMIIIEKTKILKLVNDPTYLYDLLMKLNLSEGIGLLIGMGIFWVAFTIIIYFIGLILGLVVKTFSRKVPGNVKKITQMMNNAIKDKKQLEEIQNNINNNQLADSCFFNQGIQITNATGEVVNIMLGETFQGKVVRIVNFGVFVEIFPGREGLVHISELSPNFVEKIEDIVKLGDIITVKVREIDNQGRMSLTCKGL